MGLGLKEVISIIDTIKSSDLNVKNDQLKILNAVSHLFDVDFSYIIIKTPFKYKSKMPVIYSIHNSQKIKNIKHTFSGIARETIEKNKTIVIKDYSKYKNAVKMWINMGTKSLASFPIQANSTPIGAFQLISTTRKMRDLTKDEIEAMEFIARELGFQLYVNYNMKNLELLEKEHKLDLYLIDKFSNMKGDINKNFLLSITEKIMKELDTTALGFVMPQNNIYIAVSKKHDKDILSFKESKNVKSLITYKLWKENISDSLKFNDIKYISDFAKKEKIMSGLFMPIKYSGKLLAVTGFGYDKSTALTDKHESLLKSVGINLVNSIMIHDYIKRLKYHLSSATNSLIKSILKLTEMRDIYTKGHSERVANYSRKIGEILNLSKKQQDKLYIAGLLHDIGKIGIPDHILLKPGKLSEHEYKIIKYHSLFSYNTIKDVWKMSEIANWVRHHHERCDGSGYPDGLICKDIEMEAKILAIADVFDSITSVRVYREKEKFSIGEAKEILFSSQLDKNILDKIADKLDIIYEQEDLSEVESSSFQVDEIRKEIFKKDYLTGLYRMGMLYEKVDKLISLNKEFAVCLLDIEDMSGIYKRGGYNAGDKIIETVSSCFSLIEEIETVSRLGQDSFMFICDKPATDLENFVSDIEKRLKEKVKKELPDTYGFKGFHSGYASYPKDGKNKDELIYLCIQNMKESKTRGNQMRP